MTQIITHRGLDPSIEGFPKESTYDAFKKHLHRGFGVEFDVNFSRDGKIFIFHDAGLKRITAGQDNRQFNELTLEKIRALKFDDSFLPSFEELVELIRQYGKGINALHFKGKFQTKEYLDILVSYLKEYRDILGRLIVFDVKLDTAKYLKRVLPEVNLAPSVALDYDIARYNSVVSGTLYSVSQAMADKNLFSWVWLDEWDLSDKDGGVKKLYTREVINDFHNLGIKVALVTPELHGTSPGLLGGEAHPDASSQNKLFSRIEEIISSGPDAVCTDYPDRVSQIIQLNTA